jgi:hypothetical protein
MHWELLSEHAGVFFSDLLDEYFVAQDSCSFKIKMKALIIVY